jgi:WD40 repeat protein
LAHHGAVNDIAFAPSETRLATAGGDGLIKIWDPRDGSYVNRLVGHDNAVLTLQYTSTEQFLVSAGSDAQIFIWSMLTKSIQRKLRGHVDLVHRYNESRLFC